MVLHCMVINDLMGMMAPTWAAIQFSEWRLAAPW